MRFLTSLLLGLQAIGCLSAAPPNLIFILADDLGYGDLGCFGSRQIETPNLDRMASEGALLTDFYAGSTVCAPSRCVLMTGLHTGHGWVRGNAGLREEAKQTLQAGEITVPSALRQAGYATALFGKWGLGESGSTGHPLKQGFDTFYGYLNQVHAHNFYPEFLFDGLDKARLRNITSPDWLAWKQQKGLPDTGAGWAAPDGKRDYAPDLIADRTLAWVEAQVRQTSPPRPFFLYWSPNVPHANNEAGRALGNGQEVPDYGIYRDKPWPDPDKGQAAMITRLDRDIGRLIAKLRELGIDRQTLVLFSSDNGPHQEGGNHPDFFDANGPFQGLKRSLFEGGIRVPAIAWWPGTIPAGTRSNHVAYFGDLLATACELAGVPAPANRDSLSFLPSLTGKGSQAEHPYLYWEFYEQGSRQAVRFGPWKAIREPMLAGPVKLFRLDADPGETRDLAPLEPAKVQEAIRYLDEAHRSHPNWQIPRPGNKK